MEYKIYNNKQRRNPYKTAISLLFILLQGTAYHLNAQDRPEYTLQECIELGLENNYSVRIAQNQEEISKNNVTWGNAGFLPTIDLSASARGDLSNVETKLRESAERTKNNGNFDETYNVGINLNWKIFDGFRILTNYQRLKELELMGETQTRIIIEDFIASTISEYYNFVQQKIRLKNLGYAVSLSRERLRIVEERYNIGDFSRLDLLQARVDFNEDNSKFMKQQEVLHTSRIRLNELMANLDVDQPIMIRDSIIEVNELLHFEELWNSTLNTNASLLNAEINNTLAQLDMKTVNARNYPYLTLSSGYGYTLNKYETGTYIDRGNLGLNVSLTVGFNLFDGNRKREKRNAQIAVKNARLQRQELEQGLQADISNLWQAYRNNIAMLKLERENVIAARENVEIAMERYMLGNLSGIEMREAQKSLLDAEERILTSEYDTKLCEISLLQISGKILNYLQ